MDFRDLYKNTSQIENHQSQRRVRLLEQQRKQRENEFSFRRDLKNILSNRKTPGKNRINDMFRNILMLSEWLMARPGDIEEFFIKPCPKGKNFTIQFNFILYKKSIFRRKMLAFHW